MRGIKIDYRNLYFLFYLQGFPSGIFRGRYNLKSNQRGGGKILGIFSIKAIFLTHEVKVTLKGVFGHNFVRG